MPSEENQPQRILIAEDQVNIRRLICDILRKSPACEVQDAEDGQAALDMLIAAEGGFNLVITDMQMPRMNGLELIKEIRSRWPDIPVVILTAHKNDENVVKCLEMGAIEYLTKPVKVDDLLKMVRLVFDRQNRFKGIGENLEVHTNVQGWIEITAPTDFEYVERFQKFTSLLGDIPLSKEAREDIRVAVDELGQNAVEWGNRHDRNKKIHLSYCIFEDRIVFKIEDEGEGFSTDTLRDPSIDPLAHIMERMKEGKRAGGYGVFITRKLMDDIMYSETGNVVLMTKFFNSTRTV
jgi:DNA-binding response OmpR family regulator